MGDEKTGDGRASSFRMPGRLGGEGEGEGEGVCCCLSGGSRRQCAVVDCSRRQQRKTGTRGKKTSQCRSNGYLDCCIEAGVQAMEGRSGDPVTKSGLSLGRPVVAVVWVRVAARELACWRGVAALGALNSRCLASRPRVSRQI